MATIVFVHCTGLRSGYEEDLALGRSRKLKALD